MIIAIRTDTFEGNPLILGKIQTRSSMTEKEVRNVVDSYWQKHRKENSQRNFIDELLDTPWFKPVTEDFPIEIYVS